MSREAPHQLVRDRDHPLRTVLRQADLDLADAGPLNLPLDLDLAFEEHDVTDLQGGRLTESQIGERTHRDERQERLVASLQERADVRRWGNGHRGLTLALPGTPTPPVGSFAMTSSRTAARKTARTFVNRPGRQ